METTSGFWGRVLAVFDKISLWGTTIGVALLPILFVPSYYFPSQNARALIFVAIAAFSLATLLLRFVLEKKISIGKTPATWVFVLMALVALISSILSGAFGISFLGDGIQLDTSSFLLAFAAVLLAMPEIFAEKRRIFYFYFAFLISFFVLAIFHVLRFVFGADFFSFGYLSGPTATLAGNWNDVAIIAGVAAIFSVMGLELKAFSGFLRGVLYAVFPLSVILLIAVNFSIGWMILAVLGLVLSVWFFFRKNEDGSSHNVPLLAVILFVVSAVFVFAGGIVGSAVTSYLKTYQLEAHPLWSTTYSIAKPVIQSGVRNAVFGVGPNRFSYVWQALKPVAVNSSPFWSSDFSFAVGIVPTSFITTGLLGGLLYLLFLVLYLISGISALRKLGGKSELSRFLVMSSFFGSLFFWAAAVFYVPGLVAFSLAALWTAIFFAALQSEGLVSTTSVSFDGKITRYVASIVALAAILGSAYVAFEYFDTALAAAYFQRAVYAQAVQNDPTAALAYLNKAMQYSSSTAISRAVVSLDSAKLGGIISAVNSTKDQKQVDSLKTQFINLLNDAVATGKGAVLADSADSKNWVALGGIYETLLPIGFPNAYENASAAYTRAQLLNPTNPEMYLNLARVEYAHATTTAPAKAYLAKAFALKNDYVAGLFFLSQIQISEKDFSNALKTLMAAASVNPNDQAVLYRLGNLAYSTGDYKTAAAALGRAVSNNPNFANGLYLLGLTYDKLGKSADALAAFKALLVQNPDNAQIKAIVANLEAGRAALSGLTAQPAPAATATKPAGKTTKKQ